MQLRLKVWLEHEGRVILGEGRRQLLEAVTKSGSLAAAARDLSMSYRAAWGRIRATEDRLGIVLVERDEKGRQGMHLTSQAKLLLKMYADLEDKCNRYLAKAGDKLKAELEANLSQSTKT